MKPLIGITTFVENKSNDYHSSINYNYSKSVHLAGGTPILIPQINEDEDLDNYLETIDALILSGGEDINPLYYGENPIKEIQYTSPERDEYESKLFLKALDKNIPILGICRGVQLMNSTLEGTLYQDINIQVKDSLGHYPKNNPSQNLYHTINIKEDSKLFKIFGESQLKVNSFHHQAIKKVGRNFNVIAISTDGIVEGIEYIGNTFILGVQWHPEDLTVNHPHFLKLFEALVEEAISYKLSKN